VTGVSHAFYLRRQSWHSVSAELARWPAQSSEHRASRTTEEIEMNGTISYELANVMIADRQREADRARTVATARAARAARRGVRGGESVTRRMFTLRRARTA
jgi:hypothetical protein